MTSSYQAFYIGFPGYLTMDLAHIRELLKIVAESGVAEVEIEEDDFRLVARKNAQAVVMQAPPMMAPFGMGYAVPSYPQAPPPPPVPSYGSGPSPYPGSPPAQAPAASPGVSQNAAPAQTPPPQEAPAAPEEPAAKAEPEGVVVRAPIVGTFYRAPAPDADPFVEVGDEVKPGDVLCIIEAMKLMNEIECEVAGTIRQILVKNAEPVEYDQPLFVIDPA